jgi:hypothetical protein
MGQAYNNNETTYHSSSIHGAVWVLVGSGHFEVLSIDYLNAHADLVSYLRIRIPTSASLPT